MKKFLKPSKGLLVRDPVTKQIMPEEGKNVVWVGRIGNYWKRRVMFGDCEIVDENILIKDSTGE